MKKVFGGTNGPFKKSDRWAFRGFFFFSPCRQPHPSGRLGSRSRKSWFFFEVFWFFRMRVKFENERQTKRGGGNPTLTTHLARAPCLQSFVAMSTGRSLRQRTAVSYKDGDMNQAKTPGWLVRAPYVPTQPPRKLFFFCFCPARRIFFLTGDP